VSGDTEQERPPRRSVALIVLGSIVGLIALALLASAGGLLWGNQTQRDSGGYFTGSAHRVASGSFAVTHDGVDIHHLPGFLDDGKLVRIKIDARSETGRPLFVGVARERDVHTYLTNVAHSNLRNYNVAPEDQKYDSVGGTARPAPPASQHIWVASAQGSERLTWSPREGNWSVVMMNADGSKGVAADVTLGAKVGYLGWLTAALIALGAALLGLAVFLIVRGGRGRGGETAPASASPGTESVPSAGAPAGTYPAALAAKLDEPLNRWLWLVKWLLAIPHLIVLAILWLAFVALSVVAWVAVVATGRYPRAIFDFNLGVLRWTWRVSYYGYGALGTDRYPPFSLEPEPEYPATLEVAYPGVQSRLTAFGRLVLAFPHLLIIGVFVGGEAYWLDHASGWHVTSPWSGLIGLLALIAGFALLFTGRYPRGLFDLVVGLNRWVLRVVAYAALMTDEYPPFRFDGGGDEPERAPTSPASVQF
jgi:Domain of unknown function (DUF4389)